MFPSKKVSDNISQDAKKLVDAREPWPKIFLETNQHPVYISESNRTQKKLGGLRSAPGNAHKSIQCVYGKVVVDGVQVAESTYSR